MKIMAYRSPLSSSSSSTTPPFSFAQMAAYSGYVSPPPKVYHCNFCNEKFTDCHGLSGHYNLHKNLPLDMWVDRGPKHSKIRKAILEARKKGEVYQYKRKTRKVRARKARSPARSAARTASPQPIQAVHPDDAPQPIQAVHPDDGSAQKLPWCALGVPNDWGWASNPPESSGASRVTRFHGPGGLLVLRAEYGQGEASSILDNRVPFRKTGPVVRIQGPGGVLIRRAETGPENPTAPPAGVQAKDTTNDAGSSSVAKTTPGGGAQETGLMGPVGGPPGFSVLGTNGGIGSSSSSNPAPEVTGQFARNADAGPSTGPVVRNVHPSVVMGPQRKMKPPTGPERAPAPPLMKKYGPEAMLYNARRARCMQASKEIKEEI